MPASGSAVHSRVSFFWSPVTVGLFATLFVLSTVFLRSTFCIEGGTVIGFPRAIYTQCYAVAPGGPLGPAEFDLAGFVLDAVTWYLLAVGIVLLARRAIRGAAVETPPG